MLNFIKKTWMLASILAATSSFAQDNANGRLQPKPCFDGPKSCVNQGHEMTRSQMMCAYNAPARIEVRGSWDIYATGSYIFWQAREENLDLGMISNNATPEFGTTSLSTIQHPNFQYQSGFKVGLGFNTDYDNWDMFAEYTWFHGNTNSSIPTQPAGSFVLPGQGLGSLTTFNNTTYTSADQSWDLKMDFVDLSMARAYYSGTKLTVRPYMGARGAWIRQYETVTYAGGTTPATAVIKNNTVSQGIGPRAGFDSNWLLGYGLRLIGNGSADILYTRYNYSITQTDVASVNQIKEKHNDFLRTHAAMEMGLGWGSYFDNNNWHVDLSATYGFQVFWDQNMYRTNTGPMWGMSFAPNGNLYVHGLTVNARIDF